MNEQPIWPAINAMLNGSSAIFLLMGWLAIRKQEIPKHKFCMLTATAMSAGFLVSYLAYHYTYGSTKFNAESSLRPLYLAILLSHTILATVNVFMIIMTLYRALTSNFEKHKRIARWTLPIWMYVSVTGVIVYVMLYHMNPR